MRTETITRNIYKFSELPKAIQEKVIEKEREAITEDSFWHECVTNEWAEFLAQVGFEDAQIAFSGFWSQGDGASFTASCDVEKLIAFFTKGIEKDDCFKVSHTGEGEHPEFAGIDSNDISLSVKRTSHHYSHENTCSVDYEFHDIDEPKAALLDKFVEYVEDLRKMLSKAIYGALEEAYEWQAKDETIIENIEQYDREYYEDGELV